MGSFDNNHKKILSAFITLRNKCSFLEKRTFTKLHNLNKNKLSFVSANTFYSHMRDICDVSIVFIMNEEVANATNRSLCGQLLHELLAEKHLTNNIHFNFAPLVMGIDDFTEGLSEIQHLMRFRINQVIGSHMHDFSISTFSAFETWINELYSSFSSEFEKARCESRLEKTKKILDRYSKAIDQQSKDKIAEQAMKLPNGYVSFPDKLNAVLKRMRTNSYPRDLSADKEFIEFLRIHRNTVHNGGIHQGKPISINYCGIDLSLVSGKPLCSDSWVQSIELTGELVDIYTNIVGSIEDLPLNSYCSFQEDSDAILILNQVISDFLNSDLGAAQMTLDIVNFLTRKMSMSDVIANQFVARLTKMANERLSGQDLDWIEILTEDLTKPLIVDGVN